MEVLVSLIVPIFPNHPYLEACLDSLERQEEISFRYEILLLNFGGGEEVHKLCQKREREKPNLYRYYRRAKNDGVSATRNAGILCARGKYLAFVDSDDVLKKVFLSVLVPLAEKKNATIASGGYSLLTGKKVKRGYSRLRKEGDGKNFLFHLLTSPFLKQRTFVWGRIYRRDFLLKNHILFPSLDTYEDLPFLYHALSLAPKVVSIKRPLYLYRQWKGSLMARPRRDTLLKHEEAFLLGKSILEEECPVLARKVFRKKRLALLLQLRFDSWQDIKNGKDKRESKKEYQETTKDLFGK